jgi:hypothetical protein
MYDITPLTSENTPSVSEDMPSVSEESSDEKYPSLEDILAKEKREFIEIVINNILPILYDSRKIIAYLRHLQPDVIWENANVWSNQSCDVYIACSTDSNKIHIDQRFIKQYRKKTLWILEAFEEVVDNLASPSIIKCNVYIKYNTYNVPSNNSQSQCQCM